MGTVLCYWVIWSLSPSFFLLVTHIVYILNTVCPRGQNLSWMTGNYKKLLIYSRHQPHNSTKKKRASV